MPMSGMSQRGPTVSVIIPTYNCSGALRLALQTVLWQDFADFEVWVIGDGCTDDSGNVVASFADDRLHWVNLPQNFGGPSLPRNEGLRRAKGSFIAYLGHDDLWFPWHLSELVNGIETSGSEFVYSLGIMLAPHGVAGTLSLPQRAWAGQSVSPSNWLHRKRLIEAIGSWALDRKRGDDREFLKRVLDANVTLEFVKKLSVLKFPSAWWHIYQIKTDFPQLPYVNAMRQDATKLRDELLLDVATLLSRGRVSFHGQKDSLPKMLLRLVSDYYGRDRWPLKGLKWLYRWSGRRDKGLA
jgi:glycosyltransferase involved in cell wall biosynthesis